jgi:hypothetical protein
MNDFERTIKKLRMGDDLESSSLIEQFDKAKKIIVSELTSATSTVSVNEGQKMVRKLQEDLEKVGFCMRCRCQFSE